jgi:hypothetical protein
MVPIACISKEEGFMENLKEFHDIWATNFPWVE